MPWSQKFVFLLLKSILGPDLHLKAVLYSSLSLLGTIINGKFPVWHLISHFSTSYASCYSNIQILVMCGFHLQSYYFVSRTSRLHHILLNILYLLTNWKSSEHSCVAGLAVTWMKSWCSLCWHLRALQATMRVWLKLLKPCIGSDKIYSANEGRKGQDELVACGRMISYPFSREECKHFTLIGHFNFFSEEKQKNSML